MERLQLRHASLLVHHQVVQAPHAQRHGVKVGIVALGQVEGATVQSLGW
jgi:hypothetical protein